MLALGVAKIGIQTLTLLKYQENGVSPVIAFSFVVVIMFGCGVVAANAFMHHSVRNVARVEALDLM